MSRVYDRLESATLLLVRAGAIKERLDGAWRQCLANIDPDDLPRELRVQFLELGRAMQRERPLRGEDAVLLVEWPEQAGENAWASALRLSFDFGPDGERILTADVPPSWEGRWPPR